MGRAVSLLLAIITTSAMADVYVSTESNPPAALAPVLGTNASSPLTFNFTKGPGILALESGTPAQQQLAANVVAGFIAAGDLWRTYFTDAITINVTIDFQSLGAGILGQAGSETDELDWYDAGASPVRTALINDATSAADAMMIANLQTVNSGGLDMMTIDTANSPTYPRVRDHDGSGNNVALDVTRANLKALGLIAGNDPAEDASITFSSNFTWDFDRSNGISAGTYDFIGVAAHEIGHAMGFVSGVDTVDYCGGDGPEAPLDLDIYRVFSILDLCRYSADSLAQAEQPAEGAVLDLAYGDTPLFSIDGGDTIEGLFSTGRYNGDGRQASHWKDNLGLGIMDPTVAAGELMTITALDIMAFDVIGYDLPEPTTLLLLIAGGLIILRRRRRRSWAR